MLCVTEAAANNRADGHAKQSLAACLALGLGVCFGR